MKAVQVNKLYAKLTPHEQAALAFEAAARRDSIEIELILDAVERKTYETLHADYTRRAYGLRSLTAEYGIHYWKNLAMLMSSLALHATTYETSYINLSKSFDAKLVAMDIALAEVCCTLKVNIGAIKAMAYCREKSEYTGIHDMPVDDEMVKNFKMLFMKAGDP